jgi:hypothetical protein
MPSSGASQRELSGDFSHYSLETIRLLSGENSMKNLQTLCAVVALISVLSLPTLAGEITTMAVPPPPPPPAFTTATEPREIGPEVMQTPAESETLITEITLALMQLLTVF